MRISHPQMTKRKWRRFRGKIIAVNRIECPTILRLRRLKYSAMVMIQLVEGFLFPRRYRVFCLDDGGVDFVEATSERFLYYDAVAYAMTVAPSREAVVRFQ